jgi:hypothetical protein
MRKQVKLDRRRLKACAVLQPSRGMFTEGRDGVISFRSR